MSNISKHWPTIRQVTYNLLAAGGALAVGAGWLTEGQSAQYLGMVALVLSALGNVLAGLNVQKPSGVAGAPSEYATPGYLRPDEQLPFVAYREGSVGGGGGGTTTFGTPITPKPSPLQQVLAEAERRLNGR